MTLQFINADGHFYQNEPDIERYFEGIAIWFTFLYQSISQNIGLG